jgi:hypothetical protein
MSTSLVHVLKIIGPRAGQLANECDRLYAQRCAVHLRGLSGWIGSEGLADGIGNEE